MSARASHGAVCPVVKEFSEQLSLPVYFGLKAEVQNHLNIYICVATWQTPSADEDHVM